MSSSQSAGGEAMGEGSSSRGELNLYRHLSATRAKVFMMTGYEGATEEDEGKRRPFDSRSELVHARQESLPTKSASPTGGRITDTSCL